MVTGGFGALNDTDRAIIDRKFHPVVVDIALPIAHILQNCKIVY